MARRRPAHLCPADGVAARAAGDFPPTRWRSCRESLSETYAPLSGRRGRCVRSGRLPSDTMAIMSGVVIRDLRTSVRQTGSLCALRETSLRHDGDHVGSRYPRLTHLCPADGVAACAPGDFPPTRWRSCRESLSETYAPLSGRRGRCAHFHRARRESLSETYAPLSGRRGRCRSRAPETSLRRWRSFRYPRLTHLCPPTHAPCCRNCVRSGSTKPPTRWRSCRESLSRDLRLPLSGRRGRFQRSGRLPSDTMASCRECYPRLTYLCPADGVAVRASGRFARHDGVDVGSGVIRDLRTSARGIESAVPQALEISLRPMAHARESLSAGAYATSLSGRWSHCVRV